MASVCEFRIFSKEDIASSKARREEASQPCDQEGEDPPRPVNRPGLSVWLACGGLKGQGEACVKPYLLLFHFLFLFPLLPLLLFLLFFLLLLNKSYSLLYLQSQK